MNTHRPHIYPVLLDLIYSRWLREAGLAVAKQAALGSRNQATLGVTYSRRVLRSEQHREMMIQYELNNMVLYDLIWFGYDLVGFTCFFWGISAM